MPSAVIDQLDRFGPDHCEPLDEPAARAYTRALAESHQENFTVVSWLLPRRFREDFFNIYAFCRWADELGDEAGDPARSLELLAWWRRELDDCYAGRPRHPVFVALASTNHRCGIPKKPYADLIDAFEQDQRINRYDTWQQVLDYCTRSADPVGRLVLYVSGYRDPARQRLSDATCTALQLANFWQDVRRDIIERDRVYIPRDVADACGLDIELLVKAVRIDALRDPNCTVCGVDRATVCGNLAQGGDSPGLRAIAPAYTATIRQLVERTWPLFARGRELWPYVAGMIRTDLKLFTLGGEAVLRRIERMGYATHVRRPRIGKAGKLALMLRVLTSHMLTSRSPARTAPLTEEADA